MFDSGNWDERVDDLEQELIRLEGLIGRIRSRQIELVRKLDKAQIDLADGDRTMGDWISAHLDISHQTASRLMTLAKADDPEVGQALASGKWGLDRAALLSNCARPGPPLICSWKRPRSIRLVGCMGWSTGCGI